jgi:hypothetical protein
MSTSLYPASSPYYNTDLVNNQYLDIMSNRPIPMDPSDVYWEITMVYQYRPDLLAYDLYSNSMLWWVFAMRNPNMLKDPYFDFEAGKNIYLPKASTINQVLGL